MTPGPPIILVSPSAHYPAHNWSNTAALMRALRAQGQNVQAVIFSTATEPIPPDLQSFVLPVFSRLPPGWKRVVTGKWQQRPWGAVMNLCETVTCLRRAAAEARKQSRAGHPESVLHFIGGSYWIVVLAALVSRRLRFVYSLYGGMLSGPASGWKGRLRCHLRKLLQRAVATGRLDFTCENELLREELAPLVGAHIHVIPYAVDENENLPAPDEARRRLELPANEKILLFFGTHRLEKDYRTALAGAARLASPPLALFVGRLISANDPRQVAAGLHYPRVRIVSEFVPEDMAKYYFAAADVVALPYEADFSRGSGVLIECCRHLRPMIASATPYFSAFLAQYACGLTYGPGDSASFAEALNRLLSGDRDFRPELERARHAHSWTVTVDQYLALYFPSAAK